MLFWENGILKSHLQIKLMRERSRFDMVEFGEQLRRAREEVWSCLISITSILGIVRILAYNYQIISSSRQFFSLNHILRFVLEMAIYGLILYQTYTLAKKRKNAKEISEKK